MTVILALDSGAAVPLTWGMANPTMTDVARAAGVSKNTVSLALRGSVRIAAATRARVVHTAQQMGYRLNPTVACLMAELRQNRRPGFQATLALINGHEDRDAFTRHPTIPIYVAGCRRRATALGYALDEFWLHDPELPVKRWLSILRARGIRGLLIAGLMQANRLPARLAPVWDQFPAVVTGVRTRQPALSFACADHHGLALTAFERALAAGYRRPGLVLDPVIDELVEGRFTAGYITGQLKLLGKRARLAPFTALREARQDLTGFSKWLATARPDVVFTLYHEVERWLTQLGLQVGRDIGLIQYEWRADHPHWAGMDQRNDLVGEAAVDMLVAMVQHGDKGPPACPRATLITSQWVAGRTAR